MDTIFALATAPGKSGVAVIRVSGDLAFQVASELAGKRINRRGMTYAILRDGMDVLDNGLVLSFASPASFTGEDVVEFQVHGSRAVVHALIATLSRMEAVRLAEPGEFTRRALENGKLDLTQVEGLADLIDSETEAQRLQAQRVFNGSLGTRVEAWRSKLIRAAALLEAVIDFADEDIPQNVSPEVLALLSEVRCDLEREVRTFAVAERVRSGFEVAILGAPNVGKSTLLNALAGRDAAITSEVAGTTRDVIEVRMDLGGLSVTLLDTAGVRDTEDRVEQIGVERARARAETADLRVFLVSQGEQPVLEPRDQDIVLVPKADLFPGVRNGVSGQTGLGVPELIARITDVLADRASGAGIVTRERHRIAMGRAIAALDECADVLSRSADEYEIAADSARRAISSLESVVGRVDVENLLDEIFSSFCLGK